MIYTIENNKFAVKFSSKGAEIQSFIKKDDSTDVIWHGDSSVWKNHAPLLFPFVARCLGGYFEIEGKKCEYTRNHGFARDSKFSVLSSSDTKITFELKEGADSFRYPYKFSYQVTYEVTEKGLNWEIKVINKDTKPFKFSTGTHAAFSCPNKKDFNFEDYVIEFEKKEPLTAVKCTPEGYIAVDADGKGPLTEKYNEKDAGFVPLTPSGFGNGHLFTNITSDWVGLRNKKDNSIVKISTKGFPYVMLWQNTAGNPQFVCIEPWHGLPDFENTDHIWEHKQALILLESGKSFCCRQDITVE